MPQAVIAGRIHAKHSCGFARRAYDCSEFIKRVGCIHAAECFTRRNDAQLARICILANAACNIATVGMLRMAKHRRIILPSPTTARRTAWQPARPRQRPGSNLTRFIASLTAHLWRNDMDHAISYQHIVDEAGEAAYRLDRDIAALAKDGA